MSLSYAELRERLIDARDQLVDANLETIERDNTETRLLGELEQMRRALDWRESEVKQLQSELSRMRSTKLWEVGSLYWRAHARVQSLWRR